jgi:hypothetical protein
VPGPGAYTGSGKRIAFTPAASVRAGAVALVALVTLAGCTDELEEFRDDLRPLEQRAEQQQSAISGLLRSLRLGSRADARSVSAQTAELSATYNEIAALEPPADYAEPFAAYVRANSAVVRELRGFAEELEAGDLPGLRRASSRVVADLSRARTASLQWLE